MGLIGFVSLPQSQVRLGAETIEADRTFWDILDAPLRRWRPVVHFRAFSRVDHHSDRPKDGPALRRTDGDLNFAHGTFPASARVSRVAFPANAAPQNSIRTPDEKRGHFLEFSTIFRASAKSRPGL
jgi:hypothetical protein